MSDKQLCLYFNNGSCKNIHNDGVCRYINHQEDCPDNGGRIKNYKQPPLKADILQEAHDIINGERQDTYGKPEDSFQIIGDFWNIYLYEIIKVAIEGHDIGIERFKPLLKGKDVALMMSLLKHARMLGQQESRDNYKDAIGYLAIGADRL